MMVVSMDITTSLIILGDGYPKCKIFNATGLIYDSGSALVQCMYDLLLNVHNVEHIIAIMITCHLYINK